MRKILLAAAAVALVFALSASPAHAIFLGDTVVELDINDWSSLYDSSGNPTTSPYNADGTGVEGRALVFINQITNHDNPGEVLWAAGAEELTALEYGFVVPDSTVQGYYWNGAMYVAFGVTGGFIPGSTDKADLYFIPGSEGGAIDVWLDTTPDWNSVTNGVAYQGDTAWSDITAADGDGYDYPGASDDDLSVAGDDDSDPGAELWLTGTYVPLFYDTNLSGFRDPGEPDYVVFDILGDGLGGADDVAAVYELSGYKVAGGVTGAITAYIDITGGTYAGFVDSNFFGVGGYDVSLKGDLTNPGIYDWGVRSQDPAIFHSLPEPASMTLLALGLAGLGIARRRR